MSNLSREKSWIKEVRNSLNSVSPATELQEYWNKHSIYRVPACTKDLNSKAYKPQLVSFGPFHHGEPQLTPMEKHKHRALLHFLKRTKQPVEHFVAAVEEVAGQLQESYKDLDERWIKDRDGFVQLMIVDGCFMLEDNLPDYKPDPNSNEIIRSAMELYKAGIRFKHSHTTSLHDIHFKHGVLRLLVIIVDDLTEYTFLNLMAFEHLHVGAGNDVTSYVFFMYNIIRSAKDVSLLTTKGIIQNVVGSDKVVANLFNSLSKDVVLEPQSNLDKVQRMVNVYCQRPWNQWNMWRTNLLHTYFSSPWAYLSLAAAIFLLSMAVMQTVYTVLPYYKDNQCPPAPPAAPFPQ